MVAYDLQPYKCVENKGFLLFCKTFLPNFIVPNRKKMSETLIPDMYKFQKSKVIANILLY